MSTTAKINTILKNIVLPNGKKFAQIASVKQIRENENGFFIQISTTLNTQETVVLDQIIKKELNNQKIEEVSLKIQTVQKKTQNLMPGVKHFVMISSGKGGVGKTTTSVNLAQALAMQGKKVGLLDGDIHGPNVAKMTQTQELTLEVEGKKAHPIEKNGVKIVSMAHVINEGDSVIWRGAMVMKTITQFLSDIEWGELDILVIDMPPGTGDAQLTIAQSVPVGAGIVVTTPQEVALDDAKRSLNMFEKLDIPIAGIVENMSGFICPDTKKEWNIFGKNSTQKLASEHNCNVLANVPIEIDVRECGDQGEPFVLALPRSQSAKSFLQMADNLWQFLQNKEVSNKNIQPTKF